MTYSLPPIVSLFAITFRKTQMSADEDRSFLGIGLFEQFCVKFFQPMCKAVPNSSQWTFCRNGSILSAIVG